MVGRGAVTLLRRVRGRRESGKILGRSAAHAPDEVCYRPGGHDRRILPTGAGWNYPDWPVGSGSGDAEAWKEEHLELLDAAVCKCGDLTPYRFFRLRGLWICEFLQMVC